MSHDCEFVKGESNIFTLRALLGVNARAEILAWLLTHDSGHPAAIARATGYFSNPSNSARHAMKRCPRSSVPASPTISAAQNPSENTPSEVVHFEVITGGAF